MWATLQDQSFLLGAVLVTLVPATKFGELNLANPVTGRYLALLPGAKVRDFVGPYAYHLALVAFLSVSLIAYYLVCQISPRHPQGGDKAVYRCRSRDGNSGSSVPALRRWVIHWPHATDHSGIFAFRRGPTGLFPRSDRST